MIEYETHVEFRRAVDQFVHYMLRRIDQNKHKGMREAWTNDDWEQQLIELQQNVSELRMAIAYGNDVADKAADVANNALMIWDNWHTNAGIAKAGRPNG